MNYLFPDDFRMPDPKLFSNEFQAPDSIPDGPMICIYSELGRFDEMFNELKVVGSFNDKYFHEKGVKVFLCRSPKQDIVSVNMRLAKEEKGRICRSKSMNSDKIVVFEWGKNKAWQ